MRVLIVDRKKIGVIFVVMGLMVVLFSVGIKLDNRIRTTAFIQNNLGALKEYYAKEHKITYKLPAKWTTTQQSFTGGEILYHNNFTSQDGSIHGYVQIWNLQNDLKSFLQNSKTTSEIQNESDDFKISDVDINGNKGYLVTYTTKGVNKDYNAFEYFVNYNNVFTRFAFYVESDKINSSIPAVFKAIVETTKYE
ncbi:hypothetical protein CPAST_c01750 [Clostridium pasteurianum DSM 525 = ATCC 6013]|uniref:Uncharacterized protein n=1 Tax=Clostridium pasteurianum DSM 525 = ATCC 6013 TaxID=1262449 RepID=A0A0H3J5R8_CLOPA|nr:hypothetical protein [Clostridium pasteurianum]AJA46275.1 hypothetical protein CPAST_c01750 [Clostridium pasteurianum DSM 525 = ATCC 6013]AJA50263.1 hypothetical protein CLPA_c01750 [Clostridium pasteurianum DSM 525 = ATCC 6013]AOZ73727.1 hypothetical protein AQ983_00860 [Clostridium pasteurianum DSM 525 = ATCC 6013]AOZ77524.1 hypothetical protein AQ984_00860 [Clostridium pasteurianum]ELP60859.1 hypothetical protein F502_00320 [Clostridium pasteurianum DSM 525 = ATCC 6013]